MQNGEDVRAYKSTTRSGETVFSFFGKLWKCAKESSRDYKVKPKKLSSSSKNQRWQLNIMVKIFLVFVFQSCVLRNRKAINKKE